MTLRCWALIPAAGSGSRVGADVPKQYLPIGDRTMLEWSVAAMLSARWIERVVVVCSPDDERAAALLAGWTRVSVVPRGGATRRDTVAGGLDWIAAVGGRSEDWVLVHDAARPGLTADALDRLRGAMDAGVASEPGPDCALLAIRVVDTVKESRVDVPEVARTVDRSRLWLAQTPQACRIGYLSRALKASPGATDEASAVEAAGGRVCLIEGSGANFKVTNRDDLDRMRWLLERRT